MNRKRKMKEKKTFYFLLQGKASRRKEQKKETNFVRKKIQAFLILLKTFKAFKFNSCKSTQILFFKVL